MQTNLRKKDNALQGVLSNISNRVYLETEAVWKHWIY